VCGGVSALRESSCLLCVYALLLLIDKQGSTCFASQQVVGRSMLAAAVAAIVKHNRCLELWTPCMHTFKRSTPTT